MTASTARHSGKFLSPPSARRATQEIYAQGTAVDISIPALREEGDRADCRRPTPSIYFYPRPPRGGRRTWMLGNLFNIDFYPRPPRGGRPVMLHVPSSGG